MTASANPATPPIPCDGYHRTRPGGHDELLVRVGPGTPAGEYLRRYWQPVRLARDLGDAPQRVRILGEDLVLFRDGSGRAGLVHRHCPHRRASLEFGVCETRGIRCCYHGWLFDVDGTILEIPGQPPGVEERRRASTRLGAYPVKEYKGLIFAYLGPPAAVPEFPVYDTLEMPDHEMVPYQAPFGCNWLQVQDAILDPLHTAFLHSRTSREQFSAGFGEIGEMAFYERPMSFLGTATRRVGDNVWIRVNELVLPNYTQSGAAFAADGTRQRYFGRTAFARWIVPIDDYRTMCFALGDSSASGATRRTATPPRARSSSSRVSVSTGPYEERQRFPRRPRSLRGHGRHHRAREGTPRPQRPGDPDVPPPPAGADRRIARRHGAAPTSRRPAQPRPHLRRRHRAADPARRRRPRALLQQAGAGE